MTRIDYYEPTFTSLRATLSGFLWQAETTSSSVWASGKQPLVIMCHGLTNDHIDAPLFVSLRDALLNSGISVFQFDSFGSGTSPGEFSQKLLSTLRTNLGDALQFLWDLSEADGRVLSIGLFGRSYGGTMCAFYLADPRVNAAVLASPPTHLVQAMAPLFSEPVEGYVRLPSRYPPSGQLKGEYKLTAEFFMELEPLMKELLTKKNTACPTLVIQGGTDIKVAPEHTVAFYKLLPDPKKYVLFENADHDYTQCGQETVDLTVQWFLHYL